LIARTGARVDAAMAATIDFKGSPRDVGLAANSRNRPRWLGAMPRIAIKALKASMPPHTMRRAATKLHHRNRIVRSKREPSAAFATGPIR
jgi:hypothetical protein